MMLQAPRPALPNLFPAGAPSAQAHVVQVPERALPLGWSAAHGPGRGAAQHEGRSRGFT